MLRKTAMLFTALSLTGNVILAAMLSREPGKTDEPQEPTPSVQNNLRPEQPEATGRGSEKVHAVSARPRPEGYSWAGVETNDVPGLAARLREAGFPETAVQDAIVAVVNEHYGSAIRTQARFSFAPKWVEVAPEDRRKAVTVLGSAEHEKRMLLKDVLGLERYQGRGFQPWHFRARQDNFGSLDRTQQKRLETMKHQRSEMRKQVLAGEVPMEKLQELVFSQERELREFLPFDVADRLTREPIPQGRQ